MKKIFGSWKDKVEAIIEKWNGILQIVYFMCFLICTSFFSIGKQSENELIIELLGLIVLEIITLNIKDSISHRKLNRIGVTIDMVDGALFKVSDFDLKPFFEKANGHLFISGIALNYFFQSFQTEMKQHLSLNKKIYVQIISPELVWECSKLYYGVQDSVDKTVAMASDIYKKQILMLDTIKNCDELYSAFKEGNIQVRLVKNIISTSFIGYDVIGNDNIFQGEVKEIKASFYQYKCTDGRQEPNIIVNTRYNKNWYDFFRKVINQQWEDAKEVKDIDGLVVLIEKMRAGKENKKRREYTH